MSAEATFRMAFVLLLTMLIAMRVYFMVRVRRSGGRILPDNQAVAREGGPAAFAFRVAAFLALIVLLVLYIAGAEWLQIFSFPLPGWLRWSGFGIGVASVAFWTWAQVELDTQWSAQLQLTSHHHLVTTGPYARIRHPLYLGLFGWCVSLPLLTANWIFLAMCALAFAGILSRVPKEEQMLIGAFGDQYRAYMRRTGRFLPQRTMEPRLPLPELKGLPRTLLVPLACRATESMRPDAILHDPRAVEVYHALGADPGFMMGMGKADCLVTAMRARQFDKLARDFACRNPGGLIVELGCGLDTRFDRLDDGRLSWLGIDLPEVIELRRQYLPDSERCRTVPQSMLELSWLDVVDAIHAPVIFLAEGVLPYFSMAQIQPMVMEMARRFPAGELVYDAAAPFISRHHNRTSSVLQRSGTRILWDARGPRDLEAWGLCLLDHWYYFDTPERRLRAFGWIRYVPFMAKATGVFHFRLSQGSRLT